MGLIYLDTCLVIYLTERHPDWYEPTRRAIAGAADMRFAISPLVMAECLVGPMQSGDLRLEHAYTRFFAQFVVLDLTQDVFLDAARLRARFRLRMPDALHVACAQAQGCAGLWTNDDRLAAIPGGFVRSLG